MPVFLRKTGIRSALPACRSADHLQQKGKMTVTIQLFSRFLTKRKVCVILKRIQAENIREYGRGSEPETERRRLRALRMNLSEASVWEPFGEKRAAARGKPDARAAEETRSNECRADRCSEIGWYRDATSSLVNTQETVFFILSECRKKKRLL